MTIDVMLPYYGDSELLRLAVQSVLAQTFTDWRLVCVDDGSPDGGIHDWLMSLHDERIVSMRNEANLGVAGNFSRCLELVQATHFTMMGSDDIMLPDHLAVLDAARRRYPDAQLLQPGVRVIDGDGRPALPLADRIKAMLRPRTDRHDVVLRGEEMATSLTRADWAYFPSLLWLTAPAQQVGFNRQYEIALDLGLILDLAMRGGSLVVLDPVTFEYRRHRASASMSAARSGERFAQEKRFFADYARTFQAHGWKRAAGVARRHVISRLNALSELPGALLSGGAGASRLLRHAVR
ncbi:MULTISPECIES: glycosyltransferase [Microbacterium]|uniref:glycosyltransferase family 2 protein n=1 Tax=Microbacterium TaxID=33882 RepID=UPI001E492A39|nr:glycosyltransferase [Microbacterium nymphoidis]MCD2499737.1 glycosyltransferase [Microbacterium nymphoidis]